MDSRWARVARGWTAAGFATFVAAFSHGIAGGVAPSPFGLLASLVLSGAICTVLTGRRLSLWRLALSVALSQVLFHTLFSTLAAPTPVAHQMSSTMADAPAHAHADSSMWVAHVIAGVITILAFRHAEQAFWGVAATARLLLSRLTAVVLPVLVTVPRTTVVERDVTLPAARILLSPMRHRGPPVGIAAA